MKEGHLQQHPVQWVLTKKLPRKTAYRKAQQIQTVVDLQCFVSQLLDGSYSANKLLD
jgi:hypothetical protein